MISPADFTLWALGTLLYVYVVALIAFQGQSRRYLSLSIYFGVVPLVEITRMRILDIFGISSSQYAYFYFDTDCILSVLLYFVVAGLFQKMALPEHVRRGFRIGSIFFAAGVAVFSCYLVQISPDRFLSHAVFEYSQNLIWFSGLFAFVLCHPSLWKEDDLKQPRNISFVLAVYFAMLFILYGLNSLAWVRSGDVPLLRHLQLWLPFGIAYVFSETPSHAHQNRVTSRS